MGGVNVAHTYDWGGFSGVNFMQDQTGLYVFGRNQTGTDWQLNRVDNDLSILQTITYAPDDLSLGFGFMVGGYLFTGANHSNPLVTRQVDAATGAVTNVSHTLQGLGGSYYRSNFAYDVLGDRLFAWNTATQTLYVANNISSQLGVTPVPEPASLMLFGSGLLGLAAGVRRRIRRR